MLQSSHRDIERSFIQSHVSKMSQNVTIILQNVKIVKFHYHIWKYHEKCIQISTNMPSIGLIIRESH